MKKKFVKVLAMALSATCLAVSFSGCALKDNWDDWFDSVFAEEVPFGEEENKDETSSKDDVTSGNSSDTSSITPEEASSQDGEDTSEDSSQDGEDTSEDDLQDGVNGEGSTVIDFPFFVGDGTAFEDDYVYIMPEKGTCYVGDTFRIQAEATDGIAPTFSYYANSDELVTVDERGNVTAIAIGTAYIGVHFNQKSYIVELIVLESQEV